jgi:hypothetical protein
MEGNLIWIYLFMNLLSSFWVANTVWFILVKNHWDLLFSEVLCVDLMISVLSVEV